MTTRASRVRVRHADRPPLTDPRCVCTVPDPLQANLRVLAAAEAAAARALVDAGQAHLFEHWPAPGQNDDDKKRLLAQAADLDAKYPGGIKVRSAYAAVPLV